MSPVDRRSSDEDTLAWMVEGNRISLGDLTGLTLGDFQVERLLGRGGMGEVYLATQVSLNRPVALKVLRPDYLSRRNYLDRFKSEAMAVAKLNHPNIVHVYAMDRIDQVHYIAMEYVEGTNLRDYLAKKGALELPLAASIMKQTGQAIGAAGEAGLIHRDVKPENILITRRGRVKVTDFGLCRDLGGEDLHLTQSGVTMGTPAYMSPEQAQGFPVDHRSDLYSLGVTYYFMLAGVPPFTADGAVALALKQVREIPRSLLSHRKDLPLEFDRLVMKLMAKDPADRYQSAALMLADLARIRDSLQVGASVAIPAAVEVAAARTEELPAPASDLGPALRIPVPLAPARVPVPATPAERPPIAAVIEPGPDAFAAPAGPSPAAASRLSGFIAFGVVAVGLVAGALAGWAARTPDLGTLVAEPARALPGLWITPEWMNIPRQGSPAAQFRYAQLQAAREESPAAWLAVPGYFPRSQDVRATAYTQLARIWYRQDDSERLDALRSDLLQWKDAQQRERDLASIIQLAITLRKGDLDGVVKGFEDRIPPGGADLHDPTLLALSLEIGSDALQVAQRAGKPTLAQLLRRAQAQLIRHLYRIEVNERPGAGRTNPAGRAASRSSGSVGSRRAWHS